MKNIFIAVLGAGAILAGSSALALPKYQKGKEIQVKAVKKDRTRVDKEQQERAPTRPALMAEQFKQKAKAKVARLTDQAIETLKRLIRVTGEEDPEKPDFYFRLAEHYREKKVQYMFRARELDEQVFLTKSAARKGQIKRQQKRYEKAEHKWMIHAIKMYLKIATTSQYGKYSRMDEVLYNVADMLNQAKRRDKARIFFRQLIRNHPQSKYIPDAYLSFAEFYFNEGHVEKALRLYEQVAKYPSSPIFGYSIYKQGWCWLNLKDPRRALEMFVRVIKQSSRWGGSKKSKIILVKEAKKDAVRAYSHIGTPEKAWAFFQRIGGSYAMKMLEKLANLYYDQGKFLPSIKTFRKLIALNPRSKYLCSWQYNIMKATLSGKDKRQQVVESKRLAAIYLASKKFGRASKSAQTECRNNSSGVLRELATTWHKEAQKTQNDDTYALAHYLYKEYLDTFPKEKDTYVMSYYYAELLFKLEKWDQAAEVYTNVVKMNPKGKHRNDSAYAAVISWKNALNVQEERTETETKGKKRDLSKPKPIPEREQKMLAAFNTYIKYVPKSKDLVTIMYRRGRIYYNYNHFPKAIEMFGRIASKHSTHELAIYAANLLLDSLNILKRFDELNVWVERFRQNPHLMANEDLKAQLDRLRVDTQRAHAENLRKTRRFRECGEKYAKLANDYPDHPKWPELLFNSAICFEAAKLIGQAIGIRNTLIKVKPNHPLAHKALHMIGQNYHALAWYSRASNHYEQFAKKFPGEKEAPEALQNAIVFRMGRGEYDKAMDNAKTFTKNYGRRKQYASKTATVNFSLGTIHESRNRDAAVKHYLLWLRKWGRHGGVDRQIQAHVKIGEMLWRQSCPIKGVNGSCIKVKRVRSKRKLAKKRSRKKRHKKGIEVRTQCGPETKMKVIVVKRNPSLARKARRHFAKALGLFKRSGGGRAVRGADKEERQRRITDMKHAAALARFYQAEALLEGFLEVKFPRNLDFSPKNKKKAAKSKKEFGKYLSLKGKKLEATRKVYQDVILMRDPPTAIAASARIGQLFQNFADALYTAPIPKPPIPKALTTRQSREDFVMMFADTYCDTLETKAAPLEAKAVQGLDTCLKKSTDLSWYNEWSLLCERELNQIKPSVYPIASEIRALPGYVSYVTDRADVISEVH